MARIEQKSDIAGSVWKIEVHEGDTVVEGQSLVVLESMKMEIPVEATVSGRVAQVLVREEEPVAEGQTVALIDT